MGLLAGARGDLLRGVCGGELGGNAVRTVLLMLLQWAGDQEKADRDRAQEYGRDEDRADADGKRLAQAQRNHCEGRYWAWGRLAEVLRILLNEEVTP